MVVTVSVEYQIEHPDLKSILQAFVSSLVTILQTLVSESLKAFGQKAMMQGDLERAFGGPVVWKSRHGFRTTSILTVYGRIRVPQLQVRLSDGRKTYITRRLLGIERRSRIPAITRRILAAIGALASYRSAAKVLDLVASCRLSAMTVLRAVRSVAGRLHPAPVVNATTIFEVDGTGVPVIGVGKRGEELKIVAQRKPGGGIRIAGIGIGPYKGGWTALFGKIADFLRKIGRRKALLVSDGDPAIQADADRAGLPAAVQRCLWHVTHELKYMLWADRCLRKSPYWKRMISRALRITKTKRIGLIESRLSLLDTMIRSAKQRGYKKTAGYLERLKGKLFVAMRHQTSGTTSLVERVMRTLNQRVNLGTWTRRGVLALAKVRLAMFYNDWKP